MRDWRCCARTPHSEHAVLEMSNYMSMYARLLRMTVTHRGNPCFVILI